MKSKKDFLSITDLSAKEIWYVLTMAKKLKNELKNKGKNKSLLAGKNIAMLFDKPSLRTRLSFDLAMNQIGGHAVYFSPQEVGLGTRESIADVAKVISDMADLTVARVFSHQDLEEFAQNSEVPVINALSDLEHPCQALADFMTIWEEKGTLEGLTISYVGDGGSNVAHSLCLGAVTLGMNFKCAAPKNYWMDKKIVKKAKELAEKKNVEVIETESLSEVTKDADIIVTDTWVSMGDEKEESKRLKIFKPYQVNKKVMSIAKKDAIFMHCLPAHRGNEVTNEIIDGPASVVFQEAENRLHVQKALLVYLLLR